MQISYNTVLLYEEYKYSPNFVLQFRRRMKRLMEALEDFDRDMKRLAERKSQFLEDSAAGIVGMDGTANDPCSK